MVKQKIKHVDIMETIISSTNLSEQDASKVEVSNKEVKSLDPLHSDGKTSSNITSDNNPLQPTQTEIVSSKFEILKFPKSNLNEKRSVASEPFISPGSSTDNIENTAFSDSIRPNCLLISDVDVPQRSRSTSLIKSNLKPIYLNPEQVSAANGSNHPQLFKSDTNSNYNSMNSTSSQRLNKVIFIENPETANASQTQSSSKRIVSRFEISTPEESKRLVDHEALYKESVVLLNNKGKNVQFRLSIPCSHSHLNFFNRKLRGRRRKP
jgi:hypothetical protein